ncbi:metallophosphoesterase family protein [Ancylobacter pratisalsi]|uniref:Serine/threonine protein phosphatase n=1 Tax=Ancylobacter pratisalsi TaxID=1745854 RepID=A0A6P1YRN9_9HYPH|nr:metallophosphoesterase family protein [Ancylobacter pratisalsi]QIB35461.1 serine/threonine protein phosphatase [Ancylobacter pratisalsi]
MFFSRFRGYASQKSNPRIPDGQRVYAIGDVHGRYDLLRTLLDRIEQDSTGGETATPAGVSPRIILLGDYIDRGTESDKVIETVLGGHDVRGWDCLKGNHEAMLLAALDGQMDWEMWLANGGVETAFAYGVATREYTSTGRTAELGGALAEAIPEAHLAFLRSLPTHVELGDYFFCHAGIRPGVAIDAQMPEDLMWIRDLFLDSRADHGKRIVHGHTPKMEPEILPNRINVDTGAYLTHRLSCVVLEADQVRVIHT